MLQVVLLVVAVVSGYRAYVAIRSADVGHRRWSHGLGAVPVGVAEIAAMADAASGSLGTSAFRQVVAVTGTADGETRPAPLSGRPCVWSWLRIERRVRDLEGKESTEVVVDRQVHSGLRLREDGAVIVVDLLDATVDVPPAMRRDDGPDADDDIELGPLRLPGRTVAREHTEFRIEPGLRVTVIGEIRDTGDGLRITPGPDRPVTLTVAGRSDHLDTQRRGSRDDVRRFVSYASASVAAVLVLVLLIVF